MEYRITLFTPTYNRAYILDRLYRSIQRQTFRDFEWLIIDDGSSDNTDALVRSWMQDQNDFPIRYYKTPNGGKCRAINKALELAQGELFFTMDSDDYLTDDALEKVDSWERSLPKNGGFCGVAGNLGTSPFETPNAPVPEPWLDATALQRYPRPGEIQLDGERAMVFYTAIHRQYPYPEFEGETFMTEAVVWNRMANDGYQIRFFNDIIWVYEYLEDGLTHSGSSVFFKNPRGYGLWLREKVEFEHGNFLQKLRMYYTFTCDFEGLHDTKTIASSIGAPRLLIGILSAAHKLKNFLKRR